MTVYAWNSDAILSIYRHYVGGIASLFSEYLFLFISSADSLFLQ
ncbi:hypothetical protein BACOVA_02367 [Bacteroides ovatus ATCC 8483]|uniref:Uncharacterized protein n=1 Tax=Bacteroides ovatus (strain ATCC 8483 / DSM 1896 / JCM 5824 / BCRC 10623 / CCUG 4943 / NCTC 11153) TaxID=411476 RepID=A0AAN3A8M3_BACO1|nr:hypothetical protein BACOVA_02367 [Bacteroides ovatus ATCC 8483]